MEIISTRKYTNTELSISFIEKHSIFLKTHYIVSLNKSKKQYKKIFKHFQEALDFYTISQIRLPALVNDGLSTKNIIKKLGF